MIDAKLSSSTFVVNLQLVRDPDDTYNNMEDMPAKK